MRSIPVLLTSAIRVSASHTALQDEQLRLALTLDSVRRWQRTPGVSAVVVCDGSGFDLSAHLSAQDKAHGVPVECLSFRNDVARVRAQGKGFGEGQIVEHALSHSQHLRDAPVFAKCTGKLWVANFPACLARFEGQAAFDIRGLRTIRCVDSRFYIVTRALYDQQLRHVHAEVQDDQGHFLEHCLMDGLHPLPPSAFVMLPSPDVRGVSGSDGKLHAPGWGWRVLWGARNRCWRLVGRQPLPLTRSGRTPGSPPA